MKTPSHRTLAFRKSFLPRLHPLTWLTAIACSATVSASAATITLNASDASGTTSFNTALHWSDGLAPAVGNDYLVNGFTLRTPNANAGSFAFGGDSLAVDGALGVFLYKGSNGGEIIVNDLRLRNGGRFSHGGGSGGGISMTLGGNITVESSGGVIETGAGNIGGRSTIVTANIGGAGQLTFRNHETAAGGFGVTTLQGSNTYTGGTIIGTGDFTKNIRLVAQSSIGAGGDVSLLGGGHLQLDITTALGADQRLLIAEFSADGVVDLNFVGSSTIAGLSFDGGATFESVGIYGAVGSGANFESALFTGTGTLNVVPEPETVLLLGLGGGILLAVSFRRRTSVDSHQS